MVFKLIANPAPKEVPLKFLDMVVNSNKDVEKGQDISRQVGKVFLVKVIPPPFDKESRFQPANDILSFQ